MPDYLEFMFLYNLSFVASSVPHPVFFESPIVRYRSLSNWLYAAEQYTHILRLSAFTGKIIPFVISETRKIKEINIFAVGFKWTNKNLKTQKAV